MGKINFALQLCVIVVAPAMAKVTVNFSGTNSAGGSQLGSQTNHADSQPTGNATEGDVEVNFSGNNTAGCHQLGSQTNYGVQPGAGCKVASANASAKVDPSGIWDLVLRGVLGSGGAIGLIGIVVAIATNKDKLVGCLCGRKNEAQANQTMTTVNVDEQSNTRGNEGQREDP